MLVFITDLLIKTFIGALFWSFISAYVLQLATQWQLNFKPRYFEAYKLVFFSVLAITLLSLLIGSVIGIISAPASSAYQEQLTQGKAGLASLVASFIFQSFIYGKYIKHPEKGPIGFNKGAAVAVNQIIIVFLVIGLLFGGYVVFKKLFS